jgi:hypothetical protein
MKEYYTMKLKTNKIVEEVVFENVASYITNHNLEKV